MRKEPREHQLKAIALWAQSINAGKKRPVIMAPTGAGKCQRFGTPILMADGTIRPVQDIRIGDRLASPTGIKTVLSLGSGEGEMYEVIPVKGDSYVVNADHLLSLKVTGGAQGMILSNGKKIEKGTTLVNVRADVFYASNKTVKHCLKGWRSSIENFDVQPVTLPIPPYILGIWLGDGTVGCAAISKPEGEIVKAWLEYGRSIGCDVRKSSHDGRCPSWFLKTAKGQPNPILDLLRNIGVLHSKHVPQDYLTASVADRLELIAGLLDTDGHVSHGGYDWISKDKILAENMAFLCRSIGLACYITPCKKGIKSTGFEGNYWRCSISGDCEKIPCRQKKTVSRKQIKNHLVMGIELKPVGIEKYYGFELDGDGLYMLGDFTVTHNTVLAAMLIEAALKINWRVCFVVPRLSLIDQTVQAFWSEGIRDVGVIQSNHALTDYSKPVQVASVQTLMRRALPDVDTVIVDECFTGDTLIATPYGEKRIDTLKAGDSVISFYGQDIVTSVYSKKVTELLNMELSNGSNIKCTKDHPFFTDDGWKTAGTLAIGEKLYREEDLSSLRQRISPEPNNKKRNYLSTTGGAMDKENMLFAVLCEEIQEPYACQRNQAKSEFISEKIRSSSENKRRQWPTFAFTAIRIAGDFGKRLGSRIIGKNTQGTSQWNLSKLLQNRYWKQGIKNRNRARWWLSLFNKKAQIGCQKRRFTDTIRVENISYIQQEGYEVVFNLRVARHPSYFANGILVHNCHMDFDFMHKWLAMPEWKDKIFTGLSATPWTKGLGKHWDDLLICCTTQELIDKKYLSPFRVFAIDHPDLTGVKTVAGDYHEGQLSDVMQDKTLLGHVVENWLKNGEDRPTLCFCVDCAHAQSLAAEFNKAGVTCGYQDAHTDAIERRLIAERFRKGEYRVVCSVGTLTTGVDWDVRCIILARPTKSEMLYVQMIGRGLRTADGKVDCLIFDHADNTLRMGFVTDIHHTELDDGKNTKAVKECKKKEKLPKECSNCHYLKPAGVHVCPQCGFAPVKQTEIVETHDELKEIDGKAIFSMAEKQRFYSGLLYIARGRNYKSGWVSWQYKKKFGVWPKGMADIAELPLPDCANWVHAQQIAYAKAKLK